MRHTTMTRMALPRAVSHLSLVRAESDPAAMVRAFTSAFEDYKSKNNSRFDELESAMDRQAIAAAAARLNGDANLPARDPEYSKVFSAYFRTGRDEDSLKDLNGAGDRAQINAAMSVGTASEGGYLAPVEWDRQISQKLLAISPMRRLADVKTTAVGAYSTLWKLDGVGTGWVGETAARPATTTPTFAPITFGHGEIYCNPAITQRLLDDSLINLEDWLAGEVDDEFAKQEGIAFLSGDGVNKPFGFLTYIAGGAGAAQHPGGTLGITNTGQAATLGNVDNLIDFTYALTAPYRQNASWLMNSSTAATLSKFKNTDGDLIWRESLLVGQPATLLGRPVEIDEGMPNIAANAYPIAFGDFRAGYVVNDRLGTRILRDPYTNKPYVHFYVTKRVGGGVKDPNAIRLLKVAV